MNTLQTVTALKDAGQDFEWYPTTSRMVGAILKTMERDWQKHIRVGSVLDIGAGDGRVLAMFAKADTSATLYGIEKSSILQQLQPEAVIPVGTEFYEQDLMGLEVENVFCNPPYTEFEEWACRIIETAHAQRIFLILPQRWESSKAIAAALKARGTYATIIHRDDFEDADRAARAVIHVLRINLETSRYEKHNDPFDVWFDKNISTFDVADDIPDYKVEEQTLARLHTLDSITSLVTAYNEDYERMEANYRAIFQLDYKILKELGVEKNNVRDGLKNKMAGLKNTYWQALFNHLEAVTSRLTTKTKTRFLQRLTHQTAVAFTESNCYAVVLWSIKHANHYFDEQLVDLFKSLATKDGVLNYKSNLRTWQQDGWRYNSDNDSDSKKNSHYALDYRIVLPHYSAIAKEGSFERYDSPGNLHKSAHEILDDIIAVFGNLGFLVRDTTSRSRRWYSNNAHEFCLADGRTLFQVRAFMNGNLHFKFMPEAIKTLNIEAGRLLGWLRGPADAVEELGVTPEEAARSFGSNQRLGSSSVKLLGSGQ